MAQINIKVDPELHRAVKMKAVKEGKTVTAVIREYLIEWVKENDESHEDAVRGRPDGK